MVKEFRKYANGSEGKVGFKVIIGSAPIDQLQEYARSVGGSVWLDPDSSFSGAMGSGAVPTWWSFDESGLLDETRPGLPGGPVEDQIEQLIDNWLDLGEYL